MGTTKQKPPQRTATREEIEQASDEFLGKSETLLVDSIHFNRLLGEDYSRAESLLERVRAEIARRAELYRLGQ